MDTNRRAVVLLSGGIDSATTLVLAIRDGFVAHALSFLYGQRHAVKLEAARRVATSLGVADHRVIAFDLRAFGGSALTDDVSVPKDRSLEEMDRRIPTTYVPARNTIFHAYALAWAEVLGTGDIFLGVNAGDHRDYPDCRPEYLATFEALANLATKVGVEGRCHFRLHAPLLRMAKPEIIRLGVSLGIDFALTLSCYDPSSEGRACRRCDSCTLRWAGFAANGLSDPAADRPLTAERVK